MSNISITLIDSVSNTKTVRVAAGTKFSEIINSDDVDALGVTEDDVVSIAGASVEAGDRLFEALMDANAKDGDEIEFDCEFDDMDEEEVAEELGVDQSEAPQAANANGATGRVIVEIQGGIINVPLNITPGTTSVWDALNTQAVKQRSGYNDQQMREATVKYLGQYLDSEESRRSTKLQADTVIKLNTRQASTKGHTC